MSAAQDHVTSESLALISTESFAQNVNAFRSLLLRYEKEVETAPVDEKRSVLIFKEISALQEIIGEQIGKAGPNARALGVPPEELQDIQVIYRRALITVAINYASKHNFLFDPMLDAYLAHIEQWSEAPNLHRQFASNLKMARLTLSQIFREPQAASLISPALVKIVARLSEMWPDVTKTMPIASLPAPGGPPNIPQPPQGNGGGDDLPRRVSKLEDAMIKLSEGVWQIQVAIGKIETKLDNVSTKSDLAKLEERLSHTPTKDEMKDALFSKFKILYVAGVLAVVGLASLIARVAKWL